jgi:hypothetical protein
MHEMHSSTKCIKNFILLSIDMLDIEVIFFYEVPKIISIKQRGRLAVRGFNYTHCMSAR